MKYVLGVDIGTGSVKAVAVDLKCQSFADNQLYYSYHAPKPGYHEQDPEQIWHAFKTCIEGIGKIWFYELSRIRARAYASRRLRVMDDQRGVCFANNFTATGMSV